MEVLVALAVLAVAVVAVLQLFGGGLRLARASGDHLGRHAARAGEALRLAFAPLEEDVAERTEGDYRWVRRVTIDPALFPFDSHAGETDTGVPLARVSVEVRWGEEPERAADHLGRLVRKARRGVAARRLRTSAESDPPPGRMPPGTAPR